MSDPIHELFGTSEVFIIPETGKFGPGVKIHWRLDNRDLARHGMTMGWTSDGELKIAKAPNYTDIEVYDPKRVFIIGLIPTWLMTYTPVGEVDSFVNKEKRQPINIKDFPVGSLLKVKFINGVILDVEIVAWDTSSRVPIRVRLIDAIEKYPVVVNDDLWTSVTELELINKIKTDKTSLDPILYPAGSHLKIANKQYPSADYDVVILAWRGEYVKMHAIGGRTQTNPAEGYQVVQKNQTRNFNPIDHPVGSRLKVDAVVDGQYSDIIEVNVVEIDSAFRTVKLHKINGSPFVDNDKESAYGWCVFDCVNVISIVEVEVIGDAVHEEKIVGVPLDEERDFPFNINDFMYRGGDKLLHHMAEAKAAAEKLGYKLKIVLE